MANLDSNNVTVFPGQEVYDINDEKIGTISDFYTTHSTVPTWASVHTGFFGFKVNIFPLAGATNFQDAIKVAFTKEIVKNSPNVDPENGIDEVEETDLNRYYKLQAADNLVSEFPSSSTPLPTNTTAQSNTPVNDNASVKLVEEELTVNKEQKQGKTYRIRKYVVTEPVTITIPLKKEKLHIEEIDLNNKVVDPNATDTFVESVQEITLSEEVPLINKKIVEKKKIIIGKEETIHDEEVTEQVRKERFELEKDKKIVK